MAKIDDEQGYSLSNNQRVGEFLRYGDRVNAVPEDISHGQTGAGGGGNTEDLVVMLKNL